MASCWRAWLWRGRLRALHCCFPFLSVVFSLFSPFLSTVHRSVRNCLPETRVEASTSQRQQPSGCLVTGVSHRDLFASLAVVTVRGQLTAGLG
jgi:hypothetical protein